MSTEELLNKILKEMWRLDEKTRSGSELSDDEKKFYNNHLAIIQNYYLKNNEYWQDKK